MNDLDRATVTSAPILNAAEILRSSTELARTMQELVRISITPAIKLGGFMENFANGFRALHDVVNHLSLEPLVKTADLMKSISLAIPTTSLFPPIKYPLAGVTRTSVIDREVEEETITEVIPVPETVTRTRSKLGLSVENENIVAYKRRRLKGISSRNIEGRYLISLLLKPGLFLSDEETRAKFYIPDDQPYYWIKSKLQKRFRKIGLKINLERVWNPDGYTLIGVEYLN